MLSLVCRSGGQHYCNRQIGMIYIKKGNKEWMFISCSHLEDCHNGPEKRVKVLPVRQSVAVPLRTKFATKQMHPKDTEKRNNTLDSHLDNVSMQTTCRWCHNSIFFIINQGKCTKYSMETGLWIIHVIGALCNFLDISIY